ncbi:conditioned medium-induced protein 4 [Halorarum halophilum]|uniref:Conditioned medium-induced protein 4 n=1 Tax=Halorarum halophilum TaxID=2743090 RepID=A0A7D5L2V9_9EURY|nr:conditioned medium-induced protein 4 [Halobaculum halophilum]QLG28503.1 conditioned medium-induced protein 4 [Halobaculum halophilum]
MDEKTAELRDIFIDATGSDTVTESQEESPGTLADESADDEARVRELIATMRERYEFASDLDDEDLETIVRLYHEDAADEQIAAELQADEEEMFDARMDLHLVRESDRDAPFGMELLRSMYVENIPLEEIADQFGTDEATVAHYVEVVEADMESTRANDRFRDEFAELLSDADLAGGLTDEAHEDGLREATEDMETDVSF